MGRAFNIGSNDEITIEGLADKIIELTASKSKKEFISYEAAYGRPIEDMQRRVPCLERIKKETGWQPQTTLASVIKLIVESRGNRI
jgi:UDP-glucose 4-epimerase